MLRLSGWIHGRPDERGVVGANLTLTIAFALYAVIMLSWTVLSAKQIDDRVRVIITEVGPGSNVSRLDETQILDEVGDSAEAIDVAAANLSGQAGQIIDAAASIDNTVSAILTNAREINASVRSINATASALLPVVRNINGDNTFSARNGGVAAINMRAMAALPIVAGIATDLAQVDAIVGGASIDTHGSDTIHSHANSINCSAAVALLPGFGYCGQ